MRMEKQNYIKRGKKEKLLAFSIPLRTINKLLYTAQYNKVCVSYKFGINVISTKAQKAGMQSTKRYIVGNAMLKHLKRKINFWDEKKKYDNC